MAQIFISYAHDDDDIDFIDALINRLEKAGFEPWIDTQRLDVGQVWREEIDNAIKNSVALIVVMTPKAKESEYVTYEWAFALGYGIKVLPILRRPTEKLHPRFEPLQYLNFTVSRPWDQFGQRLRKLKEENIESDNDEYETTENRESYYPSSNNEVFIQSQLAALNNAAATPAARINAANALGHMKSDSAVGNLLGILQSLHEPHNVREAAALALGQIGNLSAVPSLIASLDADSPDVQRGAIKALGEFTEIPEFSPPTLKLIDILVNTNSSSIATTTAKVLGRIRDSRAIPALRQMLNSKFPLLVRFEAKYALQAIGTTEAISAIEDDGF